MLNLRIIHASLVKWMVVEMVVEDLSVTTDLDHLTVHNTKD